MRAPLRSLVASALSLAVALVSSSASVAAPQCSGPDDGLEDNDTCATALAVSLPFVQPGLWVHRHDPDLFRITVLPGQQLRARVQFEHDDGDVDLVLYEVGPQCGDLWQDFKNSRNFTDIEEVVWLNNTGAPKALVVQVEMWRGSVPFCNRYDLSLTVTVPPPSCDPATQDDALEPNDTCATAVPLPLGLTAQLWVSAEDSDFYTVRVPAGATLDVQALFAHSSGDIDLWLYDPTGPCGGKSGELARAVSSSNDERLLWQNTGGNARDVVLEVDLFSFAAVACNRYDLVAAVTGVAVGTNYCTATPNTTGMAGRMAAQGSDRVHQNALVLEASQLPPHTVGSFICSRQRGFTPAANGGVGALCLGGTVGWFQGAVLATGPNGRMALQPDLQRLPQPGGPVAAVAGETWCFQAWYRDRVGGQVTSNLTDGLSVTLR